MLQRVFLDGLIKNDENIVFFPTAQPIILRRVKKKKYFINDQTDQINSTPFMTKQVE